MVMGLTMKVTIGLPTADWIVVQLASGWVDSLALAQPTFSLFACPTNSSTAPGNRNETNFSFSNWLLPTKSQSEANLNWTAKRLHFGGFLKFVKIYCLNLKSEGRVLATSQRAGLREPIKAAASGSSPDAKKIQKIGAR